MPEDEKNTPLDDRRFIPLNELGAKGAPQNIPWNQVSGGRKAFSGEMHYVEPQQHVGVQMPVDVEVYEPE